jgi:phosphatidate cytidylyltransferase
MTVTEADPAGRPGSFLRGSELGLRIASSAVLAPLAVAVAVVGGWAFIVFWSLAAAGVLWEWTSLVAASERRTILMAGGVALGLALALVSTSPPMLTAALTVTAIGAMGIAPLAARPRAWTIGAVPYAAAMGIAPIILRADEQDGLIAIILLFAVVWTTDIVAYFAGRLIGGPKLMPRVSPKKTWSGAVAGLLGAVVAATAIAKAAGLAEWLPLALIGAILSVCAQSGDLFESLLKRKFGAKDSGHLIPGHGGLMDRLDGFVAAATVAAVIGIAHGGLVAPARGLLVW